jgi:sterol desaturase/sphingolipid hydroxylase (fatty acid hydroxylase superfamily)
MGEAGMAGMSVKVLSAVLAASLGVLAPVVAVAALRGFGERSWPAQAPRPWRDASNLHAWGLGLLAQLTLMPAFGAAATALVNRAGGGIIVLPSHGWALVIGVAVYFVAMDAGEFLFHRAQHRLPWLWAWHSLHHSDTSYDATTTVRHFWLDPFLKSATVWLAVGLVFKASAPIYLIYGGLTLYNFVIHSNTRLDFGRWSWVLNAPAYHRIHHSASPEHFDVNFCAMLPIFDVMAGTYRPARPGERPDTGLDTGERPRDLIDVMLWPVRHRLARRAGAPTPVAAAE